MNKSLFIPIHGSHYKSSFIIMNQPVGHKVVRTLHFFWSSDIFTWLVSKTVYCSFLLSVDVLLGYCLPDYPKRIPQDALQDLFQSLKPTSGYWPSYWHVYPYIRWTSVKDKWQYCLKFLTGLDIAVKLKSDPMCIWINKQTKKRTY